MSGEGYPGTTRRRPVKWKADEDRGDFGAWLTAQVGERTYDWLADEMAARGHAHRADYYRAMAGGSKSGGRIIRAALREFFGATEPVRPSGDQPDLAAAIQAQASAIEKQADALAGLGDEIRKAALRVTGALTAYGDLLVLVANRLGVDPASIGAEVAALSLGQEDGQDQ